MNLLLDSTTVTHSLELALQKIQNFLADLARDADFTAKMTRAFGNNFDADIAKSLAGDWANGDFEKLPLIEIRSSAEINGAKGAFAGANNTIYLSRELVDENSNNIDAIANVLLEEIGHSIDWQLNNSDTPGDEGEIFSALIRGETLEEGQLLLLRVEDDKATISLNGQVIDIEQALTITSITPTPGTADNPTKINIPSDPNLADANPKKININFDYVNDTGGRVYIFVDSLGKQTNTGSFFYDSDDDPETNRGLKPASGSGYHFLYRYEPGKVSDIKIYMQRVIGESGYGPILEEVPINGNYLYVTETPETETPKTETPETDKKEIDLSVAMSASPDSVKVGESLTYTLTVTNNGSENATEVALTQTLINNVTFVSSTQTPSENNNGVIVFNLGSLASGETKSIGVVVTPNKAGEISNIASVGAKEQDSNPDNNLAQKQTQVLGTENALEGVEPIRQGDYNRIQYAEAQVEAFIDKLSNPNLTPEEIKKLLGGSGIPDGILDQDGRLTEEGKEKIRVTLADKGCYLSSLAMAVNALVPNTNQDTATLYNALVAQNGITGIKKVKSWNKDITSKDIPSFEGADPLANNVENVLNSIDPNLDLKPTAIESEIVQAIVAGNPVLLNVKNGGHWILAKGVKNENGKTLFEVVDPGRRDGSRDGFKTLDELKFKQGKILRQDQMPSATIQGHSPIELLITDPTGKKIGYDPITATQYKEIANNSYTLEYPITDPDDEYTKEELVIFRPSASPVTFVDSLIPGAYNIKVVGIADGEYQVDFSSDNNTSNIPSVSFGGYINKDQVINYQVKVDSSLKPTLAESSSSDTLIGTDNDDSIAGTQNDDVLIGKLGNDTLVGGLGNDLLYGNQGKDVLNGDRGNDSLYGGKGNDIVRGGKDNDLVLGDSGDDTLFGDMGNDTVYGGKGNDVVHGGKDDDLVSGDLGNDTLFGDLGNDTVYGGAGDDLLNGGLGNDSLIGGDGRDRFVLSSGAGVDTITDFQIGQDLLGLSGGVRFDQLTISQGSGIQAQDTLIRIASTGELLASVTGLSSSSLTQDMFALI